MTPRKINNLLKDSNGIPLNAEAGEVLRRGSSVFFHFKNIDEMGLSSVYAIIQQGMQVELRCGTEPCVTVIEQTEANKVTTTDIVTPPEKRPRLSHNLPNVDATDHSFIKSIIQTIVGWNASPVSSDIDVRITNKPKSYVIRANGFDVILITEMLEGAEGYISLVDQEIVITVAKRLNV